MNPLDIPQPGSDSEPGVETRRNSRFHPRRWLHANRFGITLALLVAAFLLAVLWREVVVSKYSGEQGVYWSRFFGGTSDMILGEGAHFKFPWDEIIVYNTRIIETGRKTRLLTRDGMELDVQWSIRFRVDPARLPELQRTIGPQYPERIVTPEVISSLRQILGNYTADEIYHRDELSLIHELDERVTQRLKQYLLIAENVLIERLDLPEQMAKGIVDKLLFEQRLLAYNFRLQAEEQEKRRKIIEAEGIRAFEETSGISMLKWRGIEATEKLANSPNAKIFVMGTGHSNLPILLNGEDAAAKPAATPPAATPAVKVGE
jgi:regulator of protease activity HflC (stomatin/prohibitin superfamily)